MLISTLRAVDYITEASSFQAPRFRSRVTMVSFATFPNTHPDARPSVNMSARITHFETHGKPIDLQRLGQDASDTIELFRVLAITCYHLS